MQKERYEGIDGLKAYAIIGIALMHVLSNGKFSQRKQSLAYPKPPSHRTCLMKKACTSQTQQIKEKSA